MFGKTGNLRCVKVWFHAFSVKRNQDKGSLIPGDPGVPETEWDRSVRQIPRAPIKKIAFSSISLQISLLPTFSLQFLPPPYCEPPPSFCQLMRTFGQHISISVTTYVHLHKKLCLNIKNLEKKIIYILIVALKFRKPEQNWARIPENPKPPARPLSFRTSKSRNRDVNKRSH